MNSQELKRYLAKQGAIFQAHKGGSGHLTVTLEGRTTQLPMHGTSKELGTGLVNRILKDLALKWARVHPRAKEGRHVHPLPARPHP